MRSGEFFPQRCCEKDYEIHPVRGGMFIVLDVLLTRRNDEAARVQGVGLCGYGKGGRGDGQRSSFNEHKTARFIV